MPATNLDLFRSVRKDEFPGGAIVDDHAVTGVLYPSFEDKQYVVMVRGVPETRTRRADVNPYRREGELVVDPGHGASLFDKTGLFGAKHWWYFELPEGTVIPESLRIRFTGHNDTYDADHYQIEPAALRMPVEAYKGALDNLARNAVSRLYANAR